MSMVAWETLSARMMVMGLGDRYLVGPTMIIPGTASGPGGWFGASVDCARAPLLRLLPFEIGYKPATVEEKA
jgi:hypothetical protein